MDLTERASIYKRMNEQVQVDFPIEDPLWNYIRQFEASLDIGVFLNVDLSSRKLIDDYYYLDGFRSSIPILHGNLHKLNLWGKRASTKDYCGDALELRSTADKRGKLNVKIACKDGVTEMPQDESEGDSLRERLLPLLPNIKVLHADQVANATIVAMREREFPERIVRLMSDKSTTFNFQIIQEDEFLNMLTYEELVNAVRLLEYCGYRGYIHDERGTQLLRHPGVKSWIEDSILLGLAYGSFKDDEHLSKIVTPGTTGAIAHIEENPHYVETEIYSSSIADTFEVTVFLSGQVEITSVSTNKAYDVRTVTRIREIMRNTGATLSEAKEQLRKEGYYNQSYQEKRRGEYGHVAVCDGSKNFVKQVLSSYPSSGITEYTLAKMLISDGVLAPFLPMIGNNDTKGLLNLLTQMILGDSTCMNQVEHIEELTMFDSDNLPKREKLSDDKSAIVAIVQPKYVVDDFLSRRELFTSN